MLVKGYNKVKGMDNNSSVKNLNDIINCQIHNQLTSISKKMFEIIEDLESEGYKFAEEKRSRIRKKILDHIGDSKRSLESTVNKFDIQFKKQV
jgi:cob(I)alamin adenosyltransferase